MRTARQLNTLKADLALSLLPLALLQGIALRLKVPRLPAAAGATSGQLQGHGQCFKLIALGESPLAGIGLEQQQQALTCRLAQLIHAADGRPVHWQVAARGGITAAQSTALLDQLPTQGCDLAIIGLGVNDSLRLRRPGRWQRDLRLLIEGLRTRLGPAPIVLTGIPDMSRFPVLPRPLATILGLRSRLLDQAAAELASRLDQVWHLALPMEELLGGLFASDGFHPSAAGHQAWAELMYRQLCEREIF